MIDSLILIILHNNCSDHDLYTGKAPANRDAYGMMGRIGIRSYTVNANKILDIVQNLGPNGNYCKCDFLITDAERNIITNALQMTLTIISNFYIIIIIIVTVSLSKQI